ncbi:MAG TPA: hypothetical protein VFB88_00215 [Xanthobacteraceae bacterium]|nr:hypothetical protein [Xanthobacteraceae bacterium]
MSADLAEIERRLRALEKRLERAGSRTASGAVQAADRMGDAIASALSDMSDRFRDGSRSVGGGALKLGNEAAKEAAKLGNDALQRLADEVERRPLTTLAIAAGVGLIVGLAAHRH